MLVLETRTQTWGMLRQVGNSGSVSAHLVREMLDDRQTRPFETFCVRVRLQRIVYIIAPAFGR